jgi:glucose-6-phosphate 1-dehydrogenase
MSMSAVASLMPDPFTLVIFGASGDLAHRKLMPAVFGLFADGLLPPGFAVVGFARTAKTDQGFRDEMREAVAASARGSSLDAEKWTGFAARLFYHQGDYGDTAAYAALEARLQTLGAAGNYLFYLAAPPSVFSPVIRGLRDAGLADTHSSGRPWSRLVVEKPFGTDLASARTLNKELLAAFDERQVFRIDHYLGKETVQNILVLRFANSIFEPLWNQKYVDHVQITVAETVGVEGRGSYYDHAGATRDILQNHVMHLVSLVAMEPPASLGADAIRDEKVQVLRSLRSLETDCLVRARYAAGSLGGKAVPGYLQEPDVPPTSTTETFVALKTYVDNWRWAGVPFYLRTGKRMPARVTEISVHFKPIPRVLFGAPGREPVEPNVLAMRIQPNEGISLLFDVKVPGHAMRLSPYQMDFGYREAFQKDPPEAYERLILDAALGDGTLFTRGDEVEAAWAFLDPVLSACRVAQPPSAVHRRGGGATLPDYAAGTWGPAEADRLIESDGRRWQIFRRGNLA